jgi:hypothetical protein
MLLMTGPATETVSPLERRFAASAAWIVICTLSATRKASRPSSCWSASFERPIHSAAPNATIVPSRTKA